MYLLYVIPCSSIFRAYSKFVIVACFYTNWFYVSPSWHKTIQGIFKIAFRLRDRHIFMWQSVEILKVFNTLTIKQIFWKTKSFFKKLEYCFLIESTKIENASFPYKTATPEANVKTNKIRRTKCTYHKKWSFASNYFIFWKFCFCLKTSYEELSWCTTDANAHICTFCKL